MVETPILYTPSPSPPKQSNLPIFYCALIIVGMAVILFGLYNLLVTRLCNGNHTDHRSLEQNSSQGSHNLNVNLVSSFRFNKEELGGNYEQNNDYECAVCLSVFEEGEEIKQLPICKHSFHASCVDMWLYSHLDCPMCRSPVEPPVVHQSSLTRQEESSPEELLVEGSSA